jgi:hypothetical protein
MKFLLIFAFTFSSLAFASDCEVRKGHTISRTICWSDVIKAHVSEDCLTQKCAALVLKIGSPVKAVPGSNRTVSACTQTGAGVIVLRDDQGNEESFCEYSDGSLRSASSVESSL